MHWLSFGRFLRKVLRSQAKENKTEKIVMGRLFCKKQAVFSLYDQMDGYASLQTAVL